MGSGGANDHETNVVQDVVMEYTRLGNTGLKVSRLALGCMSYGDPTTPELTRGRSTEDEAQPFFRQAVELGVTFWDTANVYQRGTSEEIVGRAITRYSRREDIVLATKVRGRMHDGPGGEGLSRKAILEQVDASLTRLGTDYIDLYQIHRFDADTPVEETMEACTTSSRRARCATSAPRRCTRGSSQSSNTPPTSADGRGSCPCRISTTCCAGTTNAS